MIKVKFKKLHKDAVVPTRAHSTDAGYDLTCTSIETKGGHFICGTGLAVEIPKGYAGYIFPRSSIMKYELALSNSVGVIDSGYRGEIKMVFNPTRITTYPRSWWQRLRWLLTGSMNDKKVISQILLHDIYKPGDRIGQLIIRPVTNITWVEAGELEESERGEGGYGSTGK